MHLGSFPGACKWAAYLGRAAGFRWAVTTHNVGDQPKGPVPTRDRLQQGSAQGEQERLYFRRSETENFM